MPKIFELIKSGYNEFREQFARNMQFYKKLSSEGQNPFVLYVGCSDSRVIPEKMLNLSEGDVFVVRNIANIIPPHNSKDTSVAAALEFAVKSLNIKQVIICGHTDCGGIKALREGGSHPEFSNINDWLKYAEPVLKHVDMTGDNSLNAMIKHNILKQKEHLLSYDFIRERYEMGTLEINSWLYDLEKGDIRMFLYSTNSWEPILVFGYQL
ncbi:MAG: carbonic anhydrase [Bacteroidales bacterium]|nr:carbonic anhydrase [Bacteroidales bacterium]